MTDHRVKGNPILAGGLWTYRCTCGAEFKAGIRETAREALYAHIEEHET